MRYSLFVASCLALGVLARPQPQRRAPHVVTETAVVTTTVVVYVTEDYIEPSSWSSATSTTAPLRSTSAATSASLSLSPSPSAALTTQLAPSSIVIPTVEKQDPVSRQVNYSTPQALEPTPEPQPDPKPEKEPEPQPSTPVATPTSEAASIYTPAPTTTTVASLDDHISGPEQAYLSAGPDYQAAVLYHHNIARANHDAKPLSWDAECEANARIAAKKCLFAHYVPEGADQGQNLFTVSGDAFNVTAGITTSWYQGELDPMMPFFGQKDIPDDVFHSVGHLTQLVWKSTTKVGCVSLNCGDSMIVGGSVSPMNKYTVCNYYPAGNMGGEYAANVAAPLSSTNLGGWAN